MFVPELNPPSRCGVRVRSAENPSGWPDQHSALDNPRCYGAVSRSTAGPDP